RAQRESGGREPPPEPLEGAAAALGRDLAARHVETDLAGGGLVLAGHHELEARLLVDEAPDEPGARHAIDEHAAPRHPGATAIGGGGRGTSLGRGRLEP